MQTAPVTTDHLLTVPELSARTGVGARRIRRAIREGRLRAYTAESAWYRVRWSDYVAWLEATRVEPAPSAPDPIRERVEARIRREERIGL